MLYIMFYILIMFISRVFITCNMFPLQILQSCLSPVCSEAQCSSAHLATITRTQAGKEGRGRGQGRGQGRGRDLDQGQGRGLDHGWGRDRDQGWGRGSGHSVLAEQEALLGAGQETQLGAGHNIYDATPDHSILKHGLAKSLSNFHLGSNIKIKIKYEDPSP